MGANFAMAAMSLVFWVWLRDRLYPLFSAFILASLTLALLRDAMPAAWVTLPEGQMDQIVAVTQCTFNVFSTAFFAVLFEFRKNWFWAARFFRLVVLLNLAALGAALAGQHAAVMPAVHQLALVSTAFGFVFVAYLLAKRRWKYLLPALAYAVPTAIGLVTVAGRVGLLPFQFRLDTGSAAWFALRILSLMTLGVAVARRTREAEEEIRRERMHALANALRAEALLEVRVQERTDELARSNQQLLTEVERRRLLELSLQRALEAQQGAVALQRQFVGMVSHEFLTPLAIIDLVAQSIGRSEAAPTPAFTARLAKIRRAVNRLSSLLKNVLAEDRLNSATPAFLRVESVDVRILVWDCASALTAKDAARLHIELPETSVQIDADRALIEIVVRNLVQNALKYSAPEQPVNVVMTTENGLAQLEVRDRGDGIAETERERVFDKFHRSAGSASVPGVGLGLYLSREIALQHGGDVQLLRSSAEGSVFRLTVPLSQPGPNSSTA